MSKMAIAKNVDQFRFKKKPDIFRELDHKKLLHKRMLNELIENNILESLEIDQTRKKINL